MLLLVLPLVRFAYTQPVCNGVFTGQIQDELNQPIIAATVLLLPQQTGQVTDDAGNFRVENLCPGKYTVSIHYLGFQDVEFELTIKRSVNRIIHLKEVTTQLQEVVVIEHHDNKHIENANNFVQLDEKQLAESAGKSLGESLKEIAGVSSIQTGPGIFKPVIHGVHSQRVLILNHGIRQEGQQWGAEHAPEIDPFIASNIIVIKDAGAIKYGPDALGGVIVVNPLELPTTDKLGGTFHTVLQSNGRSGTFSGMLEGGIKNRDGWGWRIQGTGKRTGDYNTPDYVLTNTGVKELNFSAAAGYHKERAGFDVFFSHFKTEIGILKGTSIGNVDDLVSAMERPIPQYTSSFSYSINEPHQNVSHNLLKLKGHVQTDYGEWRLQYGFQNNNRKEFDIRKGALSKIPSIDLQLNTHTLEGEWETLHSDKRTLAVGVSGMLQNNMNIYGTERIPFIPNFHSASAGIFGITKLYLNAWTINLGARYDYRHYLVKGRDSKNALFTRTSNFNNVSVSAGATAKLKHDQTLHLNLSSAWRPPHVAELYSTGKHQSAAAIESGLLIDSNAVLHIQNINFKTEQAVKFVTTYQRQWNNFTFEVSPYANYIFNYFYLRPIGITKTVSGVYPYFRQTQTDALFLGVDFAGTWQVGKYLKVMPKVSLLRASNERPESDHDNFLIFIPSNRFEVAIRYERPVSIFNNVYIESKTQFIAKQTRAPRVITVREIKEAKEQNTDPFNNDKSIFDFMAAPNGYWLWNVAAGVSIKGKKVKYDFRIASENTLNQQYREYTNRFRYYADDVGRNVIFSMKCIF